MVSKVKIANRIHRIEYESLPSICYYYGRVGHLKEGCPNAMLEKGMGDNRACMKESKSPKQQIVNLSVQGRIETEDYDE